MAKFQLSLTSSYIADWGIYEGVRELIQNALDADQDGYPMTVEYDQNSSCLRLINGGANLQPSVWLIGKTSKTESTHRGHYGEGLALGVMALLRAGRNVTIQTPESTWRPSLEESATFPGETVLTIRTRTRQRQRDSVDISVDITEAEWSEFRSSFLAFSEPKECISVPGFGSILLDPEQQGRCYVKGIFVRELDNLGAGFNFQLASTDRDRRMLDIWDIKHHCHTLWLDALTNNRLTPADMLSRLEADTQDVQYFQHAYMPGDARQLLVDAFINRYGEKALPVKSLHEAKELEHFGRIGVLAPAALHNCLTTDSPLNVQEVLKELRYSVSRTVQWCDLTKQQRQIFDTVVDLVDAAGASLGYAPLPLRLRIVEFNKPELLGTHIEDKIQVALHCLDSFEQFITVLVHELAHDRGSDGDVAHERAEGELFARILAPLAWRPTPERQLACV